MKKKMSKNLWWDVGTEMKFTKAVKKHKNLKSTSNIIRLWAASPIFDASVEELNRQIEDV